MTDRGEVATAVVVAVSSVGVTGVVVAVSDSTANNASFTLAVIGIITALLSAATWLNRKWNRALEHRIVTAVNAAIDPVLNKLDERFDKADVRIDRAEARQLGIQEQIRDVSERLDAGIEQSREVFAVAEQNRLAAEAAGIDGLKRLPHDPHL